MLNKGLRYVYVCVCVCVRMYNGITKSVAPEPAQILFDDTVRTYKVIFTVKTSRI
jgi:hypothetical protein